MDRAMIIDVNQIQLRVLLEREGDWWVAQCVEYAIAAQGRTIHEAAQEFERALAVHIMLDQEDGDEPLVGLTPAAGEIEERWKDAAPTQPTLLGDQSVVKTELKARVG